MAEEKEKRKTERLRQNEDVEGGYRKDEKRQRIERHWKRRGRKKQEIASNLIITNKTEVHQYATYSSFDRSSRRVNTPLITEQCIQFENDIDIIETMEELVLT